ncbi:MAG: MATE family efflux transporter [Defluviitaleaceae bacterium]|nr:MATE family efflux transporter [Defluviitaleaceae bacterium]
MRVATRKSGFSEYIKYVSLSVAAMVCVSIYVLADTWFISVALGADGLTALNISIAVFSVIHGFGLMIGIGGATRFSIKKVQPDEIFTHALVHGMIVAVIFVAVGLFFAPQTARLLGARDDVLPLTIAYMRTILLFSPVLIANNILVAFVRNDNNPKLATAGLVTASVANIILDGVFLFVLGWGMFGAALATGLAFAICLVIVSSHFWGRRLRGCRIKIRELVKIDILGSSALINELAFAVSLITFNLVILRLAGNVGVAAFGVVANIAIIVISVFTGVAQGIQPLISGRASGEGRKILKYALVTVAIIAIIVYAAIFFAAEPVVSAFNRDDDVVFAELAVSGLRIYFIGLFFAGINFIAAAFFSASDKPKQAILVSLLRSCVINIPAVIVLGAIFGIGGVWAAFVVTEVIVAGVAVVLLVLRFRK